MTRLLALASLVAGALATMPYGGSYGDSSGGSWGGSSDKSSGGSSGGSYGGSQVVDIKVGITLVSSCPGGGAPMKSEAPPPMPSSGMVHQVCVPTNPDLGIVLT